jgi:hypothetical protein
MEVQTQAVKRSVKVRRATKDFKTKRKSATDYIALIRQLNAESGDHGQWLLKVSSGRMTSRNLRQPC